MRCPCFLSACAFETSYTGPAACFWCPCSQCLWVGGEWDSRSGLGQGKEGGDHRPTLPGTKGLPGTWDVRAKPGGQAGLLVRLSLSPGIHPRALPPTSPTPSSPGYAVPPTYIPSRSRPSGQPTPGPLLWGGVEAVGAAPPIVGTPRPSKSRTPTEASPDSTAPTGATHSPLGSMG